MLRIVARRQAARAHDAAQVALHERHAGALHRDVGAGAHRDADVRLRERRRVVDAVARHRDDAPLGLQALARPSAFSVGQHLGDDLVDAELASDRLRGRLAVAGQHHDAACPRRAASGSPRACSSLIGSATPSSPASRAVDGDEHHRLALARAALRRAARARRDVDAELREERAVADARRAARRPAPTTPWPVIDSKPLRSRDGEAALPPRRGTIAAASGCSLPRSSARGERGAARSRRSPRAATMLASSGRPSVSVPVLSTTSVSTWRSASIASASRKSTPAPRPRPVATMIDIGVASPSAHGQAMISTATALTSACARRGSGPSQRPGDEGQRGDRRAPPARTRPRRGRRAVWIGARLRCASATMRTICASSVSRADPLGAHDERAGAVDRARRSRGRRLPSRPGSARR